MPATWVEVLPASEILQTLDANQSLEGLPFMPEMLPYCGRRFRVGLRAERTCVHPPEFPFRRLQNCVTLQGLRCNGSLHGDCQLGCMFFWKEAWLRRVEAHGPVEIHVEDEPPPALQATRESNPDVYFCQATELPRATQPGEAFWRPGQYLHLLKARTFTPSELFALFARLGGRKTGRILRSVSRRHSAARAPSDGEIRLQPGEWVEVKSREEILQTLDAQRMHKGLTFGGDMYEHCGRRMRVLKRVDRIIAEGTGRLRPVQDTVILEGSMCDRYFGCARGMPFLWREAWLRRVEPQLPVDPPGPGRFSSEGQR